MSRLSNAFSAAKLTRLWASLLGLGLAFSPSGAPSQVLFHQSAEVIDAFDFVEVVLQVDQPNAANPFWDVTVEGEFALEHADPVRVDGFCDAADGSLFRIRFMPGQPGNYSYSVRYQQGEFRQSHSGAFRARAAGRRGLLRVDKDHPWHFVWEGTGQHCFWNATTTYWLLGWDDATIRQNIDRLHRLKVNRLRVAICGRVQDGRAWYENVFPTDQFKFLLNPWVAAKPDSVENPGFDVRRFNVPYWQKIERMLRYAREKDMMISIIFYVDGRRPGVDPFGKSGMGGKEEQSYYRYTVARLAAYSNLMWDVSNEYRLFRDDPWAEQMGTFIKQCDPYDHLTSVHGHGDFRFRTSAWADFAMYQSWDEHGGYAYMLKNRQDQARTGRLIPQVNEEYGYEDHYPAGWGGNRKAPARSADNRRRLAWGIYMAGGYQTTGERADRGTGWGPDSGGGWLNGRGDDTMEMLKGYGHIVDFFTSLEWWRLEPDASFVESRTRRSVETELTHAVYTRTRAGQAVLYLNGKPAAAKQVPGDFSNWDASFRLALANELSGDRPWLGELHRVAVYHRALSEQDVSAQFAAGLTRAVVDPLVLYTFREGRGDQVGDVSKTGEPLNLKIDNATAVQWLQGGGLSVQGRTIIASSGPAQKIAEAIKQSGALTIEAWVKPASITQTGPARMVTLSRDPTQRNFTLGQDGPAYVTRLRTTTTSQNGEPALFSPGGENLEQYMAASRTQDGDLAVVYFSAGGEAKLRRNRLQQGLRAQWFNPRDGTRISAQPEAEDWFRTPDNQDWALLLQSFLTE